MDLKYLFYFSQPLSILIQKIFNTVTKANPISEISAELLWSYRNFTKSVVTQGFCLCHIGKHI